MAPNEKLLEEIGRWSALAFLVKVGFLDDTRRHARSSVIDPAIKPVVERTTADVQPVQISECISGDFGNPFGREMLRRAQISARDRVHQQPVSLSFTRLSAPPRHAASANYEFDYYCTSKRSVAAIRSALASAEKRVTRPRSGPIA
jgi:hypothetical protein